MHKERIVAILAVVLMIATAAGLLLEDIDSEAASGSNKGATYLVSDMDGYTWVLEKKTDDTVYLVNCYYPKSVPCPSDFKLPSSFVIENITYTVTGLSDNSFEKKIYKGQPKLPSGYDFIVNSEDIKKLTIPNTVQKVGERSFSGGLINLTDLIFEEGSVLTDVAQGSFKIGRSEEKVIKPYDSIERIEITAIDVVDGQTCGHLKNYTKNGTVTERDFESYSFNPDPSITFPDKPERFQISPDTRVTLDLVEGAWAAFYVSPDKAYLISQKDGELSYLEALALDGFFDIEAFWEDDALLYAEVMGYTSNNGNYIKPNGETITPEQLDEEWSNLVENEFIATKQIPPENIPGVVEELAAVNVFTGNGKIELGTGFKGGDYAGNLILVCTVGTNITIWGSSIAKIVPDYICGSNDASEVPVEKIPVAAVLPQPNTVIPKSVERIDGSFNTFGNVTFESESSLKSIGNLCFQNVRESFQIPKSVTELGGKCFNTDVNVTIEPGSDTLVKENGLILKRISETECSLLYSFGNEKSDLLDLNLKVDDGRTIVSLGYYAFYNDESTIKVVLSPDIKKVGENPFSESPVKYVDLSKISEIPDNMFAYSNLVGTFNSETGTNDSCIVIPSNIHKIGKWAFYRLGGVETHTVERIEFGYPDDVISDQKHSVILSEYSFSRNEALTKVVFNNQSDIFTIGDGAFYNCNKLCNVVLKDQVKMTSIGNGAFLKCKALGPNEYFRFGPESPDGTMFNGIKIPSDVTFIGDSAFVVINNNQQPKEFGGLGLGILTAPAGYTIEFDGKKDDGGSQIITPSRITEIGTSAFAVSMVDGSLTVDMSTCSNLGVVHNYAFKSKDAKMSVDDIILPIDNDVLRIMNGFMIWDPYNDERKIPGVTGTVSTGYTATDKIIVMPNTIEEFGGIEGYTVRFTDSSNLRVCYCADNTDLSKCKSLEQVMLKGSVNLPSGIYEMCVSNLGCSVNEGVVADLSATEDGKITLENINTLNRNLIGSTEFVNGTSIGAVSVSNGLMSFAESDSVRIAFGLAKNTADQEITIPSDSGITKIADEAFSNNGSSLKLLDIQKSSVKLGSNLFYGTTGEIQVFLSTDTVILQNTFVKTGRTSQISFYVEGDLSESKISEFNHNGNLYLGDKVGNSTVYRPVFMLGLPIDYVNKTTGDTWVSEVVLPAGYCELDVAVTTSGGSSVFSDGKVTCTPDGSRHTIIDYQILDRLDESKRIVTVNFNPGDGNNVVSVRITEGLSIVDSDIPTFVSNLKTHDTSQWTLFGVLYDLDSALVQDITLDATWVTREARLFVSTPEVGDVFANGVMITDEGLSVDGQITLTVSPNRGYEVLSWCYSPGGGEGADYGADMTFGPITTDTYVSFEYRYYQKSSGLISEVNRGFPDSDEFQSIVKSWKTDNSINMSGMIWTGHSSVPLIVDNYVYIRCSDKLCMVEADTGFFVKAVPSMSMKTFYHSVGYGNGLIVDYPTGKVYDLNLELKFTLDREISGCDYHNGWFYTSGDDLYKFSDKIDEGVTNGVKETEYVGTFDERIYSSYGHSSSVFYGDDIYRVWFDGLKRGIISMDVNTGEQKSIELTGLNDMFLDDAWLSIYKNVLYLGAYAEGLFLERTSADCSKLAYVVINSDGTFGVPDYIEYKESSKPDMTGVATYVPNVDGILKEPAYSAVSFTSEFVVANGYGFINVGSLKVYKMNDDGTPGKLVAMADMTRSHGSIVVDYSKDPEPGCSVDLLVYMIPYRTTDVGMVLAEFKQFDNGSYSIDVVPAGKLENNYNSQAVRAGLDGQMIWYNDSGQVYCYTTPDKNPFFFFIQDGNDAKWYKSYGSTAFEALRSLGPEIVSFDQMGKISSVNGNETGPWSSWYMNSTIKGLTERGNGWKAVQDSNFDNRLLDSYHYFVISNGEKPPVAGAEYTYVDGSSTSVYSFVNNIGNRGIVDKNLVLGTENVFTIRFFDGDVEIKDTALIGIKDSPVVGSFPSLIKIGYSGHWETEDGQNVSELPATFTSNEKFVVVWTNISYEVTGVISENGNMTFFDINTSMKTGEEHIDYAHILLIAEYDGGVYFNLYSDDLDFTEGSAYAKLGVTTKNLVSVHAYIVSGTPTSGAFNNYGMYAYEVTA